MTLSHKTTLKSHFGYFEMLIILRIAAPADYFGILIKTVVNKLLKLWLFEVAKHYGIHFEKMTLKEFVI